MGRIKEAARRIVPKSVWKAAGRQYRLMSYRIPLFYRRTKDLGHLRLTFRKGTADEYIINEVFTDDLYRLEKGFSIHKSDTVIDIGAGIGVFTSIAAKKAHNGLVFAYEPFKPNFDLLKQNIRNNSLHNVHAFNLGISNCAREMPLYISEDSGKHSAFRHSTRKTLMECITLKDVFEKNRMGDCDLLKMDCVGEEYIILFDLPDRVFHRIKRLAIRYHDIPDFKGHELADFLRTKGYQVEQEELSEGGLIFAR